tara:strand:- start:6201 stop:6452 length:252 start_codon:yes stop_codon:yes gene_type:complete
MAQTVEAPRCGSREAVLSHVVDNFAEVRQSRMMTSGNNLLEIYANEETGTWSALVSDPQGQTCFVEHGDYYEQVEQPKSRGDL